MNSKIRKLMSQKNLAFLLGAGISIEKPSNMPTGKEFMSSIIKYIAPNKSVYDRLSELIKPQKSNNDSYRSFLRFEALMQELKNTCDPNLDILKLYGDCDLPNKNHYIMAHMMNKGAYVFTTNFDNLIELACHDIQIPHIVFLDENEFGEYGGDICALYKLHGSTKKYDGRNWIDSIYSIQATLNTVGVKSDGIGLSGNKQKVLKSVLEANDLFVIGYSGYDDFDILPALQSIKSTRNLVWIYHSAENRIILWDDICELMSSKHNVKKHVEFLFKIVNNNIRNKEKVFLICINTNEFISKLSECQDVNLNDRKGKFRFEKEGYFSEWSNNHMATNAEKYAVCGHVFYSVTKIDLALKMFDKSLELATASKQFRGAISVVHMLGLLYLEKGNYDKALYAFKESAEMAEQIGDKVGAANSYYEIGVVHKNSGDIDQAMKYISKSVSLYKEMGLKKGIASSLHQLGILYSKQENFEEALDHFNSCLAIATELGDKLLISLCYEGKGSISKFNKDYELAMQNYLYSLNINELLGDEKKIAISLYNIACVYLEMGEFNKALENYSKSGAIFERLGNKQLLALSKFQIGILFRDNYQTNKSIKFLSSALNIMQDLKDIDGIALCSGHLGEMYQRTGDINSALKFACAAAVFYGHLNSPFKRVALNHIVSFSKDEGMAKKVDEYLDLAKRNLAKYL